MPAISFLDLVPKRPRATVSIEGEAGPSEFEVTGVALTELGEIARKYPAFARFIEGNGSLLAATDAMPAIIAAGLGHHGDPRWESQAASLPPDIAMSLASEIAKLTFPQPSPLAAPAGEAPAPVESSGNGALLEQTSPPRLSS